MFICHLYTFWWEISVYLFCSFFNSIQFSHSVMSDSVTPWTAACQASLSITNSRAFSNSCPSSQWCHSTISSSVVPFSSCLQSFPASGSSPKSQFYASGSQSIGVSASASILSMNIQDWFPLGLTGLSSLQSLGYSFSSSYYWLSYYCYKSYVNRLDNGPLSNMSLSNNFSQSVACFFFLLSKYSYTILVGSSFLDNILFLKIFEKHDQKDRYINVYCNIICSFRNRNHMEATVCSLSLR